MYAAQPTSPDPEYIKSCNCDNYQTSCQFTVTVVRIKFNMSVLAQNWDTSEINLVTLKVLEANVQQLSISPSANSESDIITANFSVNHDFMRDGYQVNITITDKCGRQSNPITLQCKCDLKGMNI